MDDTTTKILISLASVVVGFVLGLGKEFYERRRKINTGFVAILAEARFCSSLAQVYLRDGIKAPLYRLPTKAYETSLSQLLATSAVSGLELRAIQEFYMQVGSLNKGLDQVEKAIGDEEKMNAEYERNKLKASYLLPTGETRNSYFVELNRLLIKYE